MRRRLTAGLGAIMAAGTRANHVRMIDSLGGRPAIGCVAILAGVRR